jgi:ubiquinone/menaquinone biosynthesis C-methylase UbiE
VLVPGVGTGADLPLMPRHAQVLGVDLTPAMLARARQHARPGVELRVMDAHRLDLPDGGFDAVLLHQILNVVAEPAPILAEAARVLRPGGRVSIFDKFVDDETQTPPWREAFHRAVDIVFVTPRLRLGDLLARSGAPLVVARSVDCDGAFRIVILEKTASLGPGRTAPAAP